MRIPLHFTGICGKGMGPVASALARAGWTITGSDQSAYPPMSDYLARSGIPIATPYSAANLQPAPTLHVVGKRIHSDNPELVALLDRGLARVSLPELLARHVLERSRLAVVAGGVGKTTTTALLVWLLEQSGHRPDYLIGGETRGLDHPARFEGAPVAVVEGDEYASCFDDPRPKFAHYRPEVAIITNTLEDHPDLYPNHASVIRAFSLLTSALPESGRLILSANDPATAELVLATGAAAHLISTAPPQSPLPARAILHHLEILERGPHGTRFSLDGTRCHIPLCGEMNARNAAMALLAADSLGLPIAEAIPYLSTFPGIARRQQTESIGGVILAHDKATHPQALPELFDALRQKHPGRRLISIIQPRATGGRDWVYQSHLPAALANANAAIITTAYEHDPGENSAWPGGPFCTQTLVEQTRALGGRPVLACHSNGGLADAIHATIHEGDLVVLTLPEQAEALRDTIRCMLGEIGIPGDIKQP